MPSLSGNAFHRHYLPSSSSLPRLSSLSCLCPFLTVLPCSSRVFTYFLFISFSFSSPKHFALTIHLLTSFPFPPLFTSSPSFVSVLPGLSVDMASLETTSPKGFNPRPETPIGQSTRAAGIESAAEFGSLPIHPAKRNWGGDCGERDGKDWVAGGGMVVVGGGTKGQEHTTAYHLPDIRVTWHCT